MYSWSVSILPQHLAALLEQLSTVDPTRLAITRSPGKQRQTVQFFAETKAQATALQKRHGGQVAAVTDAWKTASPPHPPIHIRQRFLLVEMPSPLSDPREIIIPAGLAFGTGDHPTTATCLRLLCDVAADLQSTPWSFLDAGTGSGVLAIAAKKLGANRVAAFDYDPLAVRTARENARLNDARGITWSQRDLQTLAVPDTYDIVTANIFSELFLGTWPRLRPCLAPGGAFILSGILRFQAANCRTALEKTGFTVLREVRLGKWVTLLARAPR